MSNIRDYIEYYKYGYDDNVPIIPAEDRGEGPATDKLDIGGRDAGEIVIPEDKYLDGVETNNETKEVNFKVTNGEDVKVSLASLDDPNIDCSTF